MFNTATNDIYMISAIQEAWKHSNGSSIDMNKLQSLDIQQVNEYGIPESSTHDRVDTTVVLMDDVNPNRNTNTNVIAVVFRHFYWQQRNDNYGCRIYVK